MANLWQTDASAVIIEFRYQARDFQILLTIGLAAGMLSENQ